MTKNRQSRRPKLVINEKQPKISKATKTTTMMTVLFSYPHSPMQPQPAPLRSPLRNLPRFPFNHIRATNGFPTPDSSFSRRSLAQRQTYHSCRRAQRNKVQSSNSKLKPTKIHRIHRKHCEGICRFAWF